MFHHVIFAKLEAKDQVCLGLCGRQLILHFWQCLGSKMWYKYDETDRHVNPKSGMIRKLSVDLSDFPNFSHRWDHLTHLHIADTDDTRDVNNIVLPPNLSYCFLAANSCLRECILPMLLKCFETHDNFTRFLNLNNHPNLTILRMSQYSDEFILPPPCLVEFSIGYWTNLNILPLSLVSLTVFDRDVHFKDLPASLTKLEMFNGVPVAKWKSNVREDSE